jgi:FixJ family two-component response regulator
MGETVHIIHHLLDERTRLVDALKSEPVFVKSYDNGEQFFDQVTSNASGCVLVPRDLPGMGLRRLMIEINRRDLALAVVVLGHVSEFSGAVELLRAGAFDFLEMPISGGRVRSVVRRAIGAGI